MVLLTTTVISQIKDSYAIEGGTIVATIDIGPFAYYVVVPVTGRNQVIIKKYRNG